MKSSLSASVEATYQLAGELAGTLHPGDVVALHGDLGSGKTTFVRGMVEGLGGDVQQVSSPTFVLLNVYQTPRSKVFHLDAYRATADDFESFGFEELIGQGVVIVEWAEKIAQLLPAGTIHVKLSHVDQTHRHIEWK